MIKAYIELFPQDKEFMGHLSRQLTFNNEPICSRSNFSGHLTASALVFDRECKNTLLIHHKFLKRWLHPGGHLEAQEHPVEGAYRECLEETGLSDIKLHPWHCPSLLPLDIDSHQIPANPDKQEFFHHHHDFLYVFQLTGGAENDKIQLQLAEVSDYRWVSLEDLASGNYGKRMVRSAAKINGGFQS